MKAVFKKYTGVVTDEELTTLLSSKNYKEGNYMEVSNSNNLAHHIVNILSAHLLRVHHRRPYR